MSSESKMSVKAMQGKKAKKAIVAKGRRGKQLVYKGRFVKTAGGLTKDALTKSKAGKIVSKKLQAHGKRSYANIRSWVEAFMKARIELKLRGFVAAKKGSLLYDKTRMLYQS